MRVLQGRPWIRVALPGLVMALLSLALDGFHLNARTVSDGLSLAAITYLIAAAWRFVMRQGAFASLQFGMRKLAEIIRTRDYRRSQTKLPSMGDYMASYHYDKPSLPYLIAAAMTGAAALLVWRWFGG